MVVEKTDRPKPLTGVLRTAKSVIAEHIAVESSNGLGAT